MWKRYWSWVFRQSRHVAHCIGLSLPGDSFWQLLMSLTLLYLKGFAWFISMPKLLHLTEV
jgi:hypothetical protein